MSTVSRPEARLPAGARTDSALLSTRQSCKVSSSGCRPGPTCSSRPCR